MRERFLHDLSCKTAVHFPLLLLLFVFSQFCIAQDLESDDAEGSDFQAAEATPFEPPSYTPSPDSKTGNYPFLSGRNEAQRSAALAGLNAQLQKKPFILPRIESAPTTADMLRIAGERHKAARQKFTPRDQSYYSRLVNWVPQFDGKNVDSKKAAEYSIAVALATSHINSPQFVIASAAAVFALDPKSPVAAGNLGAAIVSAGEVLSRSSLQKEPLAGYQKDAEASFLYAISVSMKDNLWNEKSLTPIINMGNLCIDLRKLEEARSLFQVARRIKPTSWDAALGLAAYFHASKQPLNAQIVLEDDNLDRPQQQLTAIRSVRSLRKSDEYADLPIGTPDEVYEKGIAIMSSEPIATSVDFLSQLDQSERNKMRYFIENLPPKGSFVAPSIDILSQYSTLKAISSPQGVTALQIFESRFQAHAMSSAASRIKQQLEMLSRMGLKINPGVDLEDMERHPEKYADQDFDPEVEISGMEDFLSNVQEIGAEAASAQRKLGPGKPGPALAIASQADPYFTLLRMDPDRYADPMNILLQKHNFAVYNRKTNLYNGYLHSVNKRVHQAVLDDVKKTETKTREIQKRQEAETKKYLDEKEAAEESGVDTETAEWKLRLHAIHRNYFAEYNNAAETGFGSATNTASIAYTGKIKPTAEAYYYDVIRHVALISDPDVRKQKEAVLRDNVRSALTWGLQSVLAAFSSFSYKDEWDCDCDLEALLEQREAELQAREAEEEARVQANIEAKRAFDSREIPESSTLFKKLDSYYDEYNFLFVKVRASCARTVFTMNSDALPNNLPVKLLYTSSESEFSGAIKRDGEIKVGISEKMEGCKASVNANLKVSVSSDGQGAITDYSITPGAEATVSVGDSSASVGANVVIGPDGARSAGISADVSVKYGETAVRGGANVTFGRDGRVDSEYSAGVQHDLKNELGGSGEVAFEASTKRGCSLSGKVEQSLQPAEDFARETNVKGHAAKAGSVLPTDSLTSKELWSGKYEVK